jgi:hypothetical protein
LQICWCLCLIYHPGNSGDSFRRLQLAIMALASYKVQIVTIQGFTFSFCYFLLSLFGSNIYLAPVAYPEIFFGGGVGGSTNSVEDRGQREQGSGAVARVRVSAEFANG